MKRLFKYIVPVILVAIIVGIAYKAGFIDLRRYPVATGPKQVVLNCTYHGQKLTINENLYQSVDEYYASDPRKMRLDYKSFVSSNSKDLTIKDLTQKIKVKGTELGLSSDQTMDLATCFVQNIPYDTEKAKIVLSQNPGDKLTRVTQREYYDRFPYETLYENKGICTDKSYLEAAILKEMGYGASILTFNTEKHMAVGVQTPKGYTSFNTDYSYVETTSPGYKVGQLPSIDKNTGGAKKAELDKVSGSQGNELIPQFPESDFSPPSEIIKISDGKEYQRIIEITNDINRLKSLVAEINSANTGIAAYKTELKNAEGQAQSARDELSQAESKVNNAKNIYKSDSTEGNYASYTAAYDEYQSVYKNTRSVINGYNSKVNQYNSAIGQLNGLIDEYNKLIKSD
ncbi:MAG: transglutaminase-like domain-containing protein [bacterium]|nr:transglutaminase-like domain-containing protein [bacterium]